MHSYRLLPKVFGIGKSQKKITPEEFNSKFQRQYKKYKKMSVRFYNILEIMGDEAQVSAVKEFIRGGKDKQGQEIFIDFNKIVKMPEEIQKDLDDLGEANWKVDELNKERARIWNEIIGKYNDWCYDNWECKWQAWDQSVEEDNLINYTTANGRAKCLIEKLSRLFPKPIFVLISLCESPDDFVYHYQNGILIKYGDWDYLRNSDVNLIEHKKSKSKIESRFINILIKQKQDT
jgi:hypothetical protein